MQITLNERGVYQARHIVVENGRRKHKVTSLRTSLRDEAEARAKDLIRGVKPEAKAMTVPDAIQAYIDQHLAKKGQDRNVFGATRRAIADHFKRVSVPDVTDRMIETFTEARIAGKWSDGKRIAPQTVRKELNILQAALNFVISKRLVRGVDPFHLPKPPESQPKDLWMTEKQERKMMDALPDQSLDMQIFVRLALSYGARKQAIVDLTWDQVDFDRGEIDFNRPGAIKTRKRRSRVPMTAQVRDVLMRKSEVRTEAKVIDRNTPLRFRTFAESVGLPWVTPHVLKHTAITLMLRAGVSMDSVSALTATDIRTIQKTYRHHCANELCAAAERKRT